MRVQITRGALAAAAAAALITVGGCSGTAPSTSTGIGGDLAPAAAGSPESPPSTTDSSPELVPYGQSAKVDDFRVRITDYRSESHLGGQFGTDAQGVYKVVEIKVTNEGTEPAGFNLIATAYDAAGAEFSTDPTAGYMEGAMADGRALFNEINPGSSASGIAAFDVAEGTELTRVEIMEGFGVPVTFKLP